MTEDRILLVIAAMVVLGTALYHARMRFFRTGPGGGGAIPTSQIVEDDGHLDFDGRLARRLSELERDQVAGPASPPPPAESTAGDAIAPLAAPAPRVFGRRGL